MIRHPIVLPFLICLWANTLPALASSAEPAKRSRSTQVGADRVFDPEYFRWIEGKRIGLITNATGVDSNLRLTADLLSSRKQIQLIALFGPEHGFLGEAQAGQRISSNRKVYSLYGRQSAPTDPMLEGVEILVYDIQDVGTRFYTYISTMVESMRAAARKGIPFVVLDRPDPITGQRVEGPVRSAGYQSFLAIHAIPVRYGMTAGELAQLVNSEAGIGCDLRVVPLKGWKRGEWYDQTGLVWIMPSPNMPTLDTAIVYPGFCLIEGTNLSEGRGTTRPFELIGAPWLDSQALARRLNDLKLRGALFRTQAFTPTFSKYQGTVCQGVQIHVLDRDSFQPVDAALHFLAETLKLHRDQLKLEAQAFDRLIGNSWVRERLLAGEPVEAITKSWADETSRFARQRGKYLLY